MKIFYNRKSFCVLMFLLIAGLLLLAGCGGKSGNSEQAAGTSDQPLIIKFSHVTAPDSPKGAAAQRYADLVTEKTQGRVKVEVYPSSQLYGDKEELEALMAGNVHIIAPTASKMLGLVPAFQIFDLPFLFPNKQVTYAAFDGEVGQKLFEQLEMQGIKGLAFWENGFKHFGNNKRPLTKPEDFKGLKFRIMAGKVLEAQFKALGAAGAVIPFGETYTALQQGTVDGQENTWNNMETQAFYEVQPYITASNHGRLDYVILANSKFWSGLPEDIRTVLEETMQEVTAWEREQAENLNNQSLEIIKAYPKCQVYELSPEEQKAFRDAMEPVWKEFEDVIGKDLIEGVKSLY